jgi:hypothetical protein
MLLRNKLIVLSPPKTGSNSLQTYLTNNGIEFDEPLKIVKHPTIHLTLSELIKMHEVWKEQLVDYKIIQIVRNPYDRFVSAFLHQNRMLEKKLDFNETIDAMVESKMLLPNNCEEFFQDFYVLGWAEKSFRENNWGGLRLWYEQNWYNDLFANVKTFKLEDLQKDTTELNEYLKIEGGEFPLENQSGDSSYEDYYTPELKNIVGELYKRDFMLYGYEL